MSKHRLIFSLIFELKIFPQALLIRLIENFNFYYKVYFHFENVKKAIRYAQKCRLMRCMHFMISIKMSSFLKSHQNIILSNMSQYENDTF